MSAPPASVADSLRSRYTLERELGRGGMATVYLARDLKHDRSVALKVLHPELAATLGPARFLQEIQVTARLQHPHILPLIDSGEASGLVYYLMPYVEGESLRERLRRDKQLPVEDALRISREVALALDYAHRQGVVHRDIKPENILLSDNQALVADFGVARAVEAAGGERLTGTGLSVGTPSYMSPEQAAGERDLDSRTDIYSLGCVLYEMLVGEAPFSGPSARAIAARHSFEPMPSVRVVRPTVSEAIEQVIRRSMAKVPADRFATAAEFAEALSAAGRGEAPPATPSRSVARHALTWRLLRLSVAISGVAAAIVAAVVLSPRRPEPSLDPDLVAVAPFQVLGADPLWREGLVDVLARSFDGLGPLRTVAPTTVLRRWRGRADPETAADLGRHTGAGLVVFGQLAGLGGDSVRISGSLLDVAAGKVVAEFERADRADHIPKLADSLSLVLLRGRGGPASNWGLRLGSVGTGSLPALKAFLRGEQYFRRSSFDSAIVDYDHAVVLDSMFAFAIRRAGLARGWRNDYADWPIYVASNMKAGRLNHGLAPHDSLLLAADSADGAAEEAFQPDVLRLVRRIFDLLGEATRRYPEDAEIWYRLGEAYYHHGQPIAATPTQALAAFDRAIAIDSTFGPAYLHVIDLALLEGDSSRARRYIHAYAGLPGILAENPGLRLVEMLHDPTSGGLAGARRVLDTISTNALKNAMRLLRYSPDSGETGIRLARLEMERLSGRDRGAPDSLERRTFLAIGLGKHGHLREAYAVAGHRAVIILPALVLDLALLGVVPEDSATAVFGRWLRSDDVSLAAVPGYWWASRGDTLALLTLKRRADSLAAHDADSSARIVGRETAARSLVQLALARQDSAEALRLNDLPGARDRYPRPLWARLLTSAGRDREAAAFLEWSDPIVPSDILGRLELGRISERLGRSADAIRAYRFVAVAFAHPDPELVSYRDEARAALERLGAERRR